MQKIQQSGDSSMTSNKVSTKLNAALLIITVAFLVTSAKAGTTEQVLYNFKYKSTKGANPNAGLTRDATGNLYGTTMLGGALNWSTVFELSPKAGGGWTEKVLHSFKGQKNGDGTDPWGSLIFDSAGNVYGTASGGGACGGGIAFELVSQANGNWTEKILHSFGCGSDGAEPLTGLTIDTAGNLYGTTYYGGSGSCNDGNAAGCGVVFELTPQTGGGWTETVLYSFSASGGDGNYPEASLLLDASGNLYSITTAGGTYTYGTAFELIRGSAGSWTEQILHSFNGNDGSYPFGNLIFDASGNLYGTTSGNLATPSTVFELKAKTSGGWTEKVLHYFYNSEDGLTPEAGVVFDKAGNLYGTTLGGGSDTCYLGCGVVFELTPQARGTWTEKVLHRFIKNGKDGELPACNLVFDSAGHLYGTTQDGGADGEGTTFELKP
jgi:uncharacterized repeat protein (TIGR03803 family)